MTGFARAVATLPQGAMAWEVRSVNNKGLDLRIRLPPGFESEDAAVRGLIAGVVTRGSVQATLNLQRTATTPRVRIDHALLGRLVAELATVRGGTALAPPTMDGLLAIRGVVEVVEAAETPVEQAGLKASALESLGAALADLAAGQQEEGAALGRVLSDQLSTVATLVSAAEAAPGRQPAAVQARLSRAVEALAGAAPSLDPERLHQEALLLAARADVREELDRLVIHVRSARELLGGGGPIGRRLDFLAQELAREANTLCAKSNDAELTAIGLDLRTTIEQFREQVQNLE